MALSVSKISFQACIFFYFLTSLCTTRVLWGFFYHGLYFLLFIQQTGKTVAEKALEDDRFDAQKWLNFHDVQVRQTQAYAC